MKTILLIAHLIAIATGTGMSIANYINIRIASGEKGDRREALAYLRRVLARIADKEKVQVQENDINTFIYREAMRTSQQPDKLAKELAKNRDALRAVQQSIIFDKAVDFLVSKAKVDIIQSKA